MPYSYTGLDHWFERDLVELIKPATMFDVGVGAGKIGKLIDKLTPCLRKGFDPKSIPESIQCYNQFEECLFQDWIKTKTDWSVDLVVFGDVLEHMEWATMRSVLDFCQYRCKWMAIFTPLHYLQNSAEGNIHEAHRCVVRPADLLNYKLVHYVLDLKEDIYYALLKGLL